MSRQCKGSWKTAFYYCVNKKEVNELKDRLRRGHVMEVYRAEHNFVEAWTK